MRALLRRPGPLQADGRDPLPHVRGPEAVQGLLLRPLPDVARDAGRRVVACASLEVVAFSAATREVRPLEDGDAELMEHESLAAVLNHLLVKPGLRRNGLAHQLCLHLEDVAEAWGLATLLMFPPERNGDARWLCAKLGMREGFRTDSTRDPSRRVVAMGKVPGKRNGMRMAPIGLDKDLEDDDDYENPPPGQ